MTLKIETEQEQDGRWLADVVDLPGAMAYGETRDEALTAVEALAFNARWRGPIRLSSRTSVAVACH